MLRRRPSEPGVRRFDAPGSSKPRGLAGVQRCRTAAGVGGSRRRQWVCTRWSVAGSSGVAACRWAVIACRRVALRTVVSHCSHSLGVCGSPSACSSRPPQSGQRPRCGGHLHEASSGVHSRSPIPPGGRPPPDARQALPRLPTGLLLACGSRMEREPLGFFPELRTPQLPATHVGAETGHHALARVLHLRHQPNLQTVPPT